MIDIIGMTLEQFQELVTTFIVPGLIVTVLVQLVYKPGVTALEKLILWIASQRSGASIEAGDFWTDQGKPWTINLGTYGISYLLMLYLGFEGGEALMPALFTLLAATGEYEVIKNSLTALGWKWH